MPDDTRPTASYAVGMTDDLRQVTKYGATVPISDEALHDETELRRVMDEWSTATPQRRAQWRAEAVARAAAERAAAPTAPLTLDALLDRLGLTRAFAEHLVQPYCDCQEDSDGGWNLCGHAYDLGLQP